MEASHTNTAVYFLPWLRTQSHQSSFKLLASQDSSGRTEGSAQIRLSTEKDWLLMHFPNLLRKKEKIGSYVHNHATRS